MFVREKRIGDYSYLYLVETVRENGKTKQRIIRNLGRKEMVDARGDLDRLARSAARLSQRSMIVSLIEDGSVPDVMCRRIGAPLLFERLWRDSGCRTVVEELLVGRRFEFAVERAVFLTVLHRLMVSGSDRACEYWRDDYRLDGIADLQLHHLYRAMTWLGEELASAEQAARTLVPRCTKDLVEERLFARRRDLFSDLSVVFMDTTSLYFEGRGGETLGQFGHSKDYRPHLKQMIVGIIIDQAGRPVCSEMWPGDTADVTTLVPVIDRLRRRFGISRVCVVADRGMISAETIVALEQRGLEYILGVRERSSKEVREIVLKDQKPSVPLVIPRPRRPDTELEAKEVCVGERRYVVCRNLVEARRDAEVRETVLRNLRASLRGGDKALIGNSAYRRYLKTPDQKHFEIDQQRVAEDARYDGLLCAADQHASAPARRHASLSPTSHGGGHLQDDQGDSRHPTDLSPNRRRHPRPRVLLVPGPGPAQGSGRPPRRRPIEAGVGRTADGSRPPPGNRNRTGRQALHPAHAGDRRRRSRLPGGRRGAAAQHP
jgi:Transposase DDE domain